MKLRPASRICGNVAVPGDKSISHRAAIISALAKGTSHLSNFATSDDCRSTLACLRQLGVQIEKDSSAIIVHGIEESGFRSPSRALDCGNSGSTMRMLAGVVAAQPLTAMLTGDSSLLSRPMKRVIEPLEMMGASIQSQDGRPPLTINGNPNLVSLDYSLPVPSAQVKSALLLAGMYAQGRTIIHELRGSTRDHTERMLNWFGVGVETRTAEQNWTSICIDGGSGPVSKDVAIPGDISSAAFLIVAAALLNGSKLEITDVGLNPTRTGFLEMLQHLGLDISFVVNSEECNEPVGTIVTRGIDCSRTATHGGITIEGSLISQLIDELPLLAVVATQIEGGITFRGAQELRLKESDRIAATAKNLRAMRIEIEEFSDGLNVPGPQKLHGARLESFGDHRIAMAFTVAALLADTESELQDTSCVSVSFPEFFEIFERLIEH